MKILGKAIRAILLVILITTSALLKTTLALLKIPFKLAKCCIAIYDYLQSEAKHMGSKFTAIKNQKAKLEAEQNQLSAKLDSMNAAKEEVSKEIEMEEAKEEIEKKKEEDAKKEANEKNKEKTKSKIKEKVKEEQQKNKQLEKTSDKLEKITPNIITEVKDDKSKDHKDTHSNGLEKAKSSVAENESIVSVKQKVKQNQLG